MPAGHWGPGGPVHHFPWSYFPVPHAAHQDAPGPFGSLPVRRNPGTCPQPPATGDARPHVLACLLGPMYKLFLRHHAGHLPGRTTCLRSEGERGVPTRGVLTLYQCVQLVPPSAEEMRLLYAKRECWPAQKKEGVPLVVRVGDSGASSTEVLALAYLCVHFGRLPMTSTWTPSRHRCRRGWT